MGGIGSGGGKGSSAGRRSLTEQVRSASNYIGDRAVEEQIKEQIRYDLGSGEQFRDFDDWKVVNAPKGSSFADVEVSGHTDIRIDYGNGEVEYDTEYWTRTYQLKVRK